MFHHIVNLEVLYPHFRSTLATLEMAFEKKNVYANVSKPNKEQEKNSQIKLKS